MMRAVKIIAVVIALSIGIVLAVAATRPDMFEVRRSARINAAPERIFPLIDDLRAFNTWNPYEKKDPAIKGVYGGAPKGKGATYAFQGGNEVGSGRLEIIDSKPVSKVTMTLLMAEPFEVSNVVEFVLEPQGDTTNVTWAMRGRVPYVAKILHMFVDVDAMVGHDFEAGLAALKSASEQRELAVRTN